MNTLKEHAHRKQLQCMERQNDPTAHLVNTNLSLNMFRLASVFADSADLAVRGAEMADGGAEMAVSLLSHDSE
jgi:hypothetical protein